MRYVCVLLCVVACGPGLARGPQSTLDARVVAREALAKAVVDVAAMTPLLRGSVVNGGLWFENSSCRQKFPPGEIDPKLTGELARCLVDMKLKLGSREDALVDVVVLSSPSGFELEARVVHGQDGAHLSWIGFATRSEGDHLPTISGETLELLRESGTRDGPLPADVTAVLDSESRRPVQETSTGFAFSPKPFAFTWVKVCLDASGAVTSVVPYETTSHATQAGFVEVAKTWTFRPFQFGNQALPVCGLARMTHPAGAAPTPEVLPLPLPPRRAGRQPIVLAASVGFLLLEKTRIAGEKARMPTDLERMKMEKAGIQRIRGTFRFCVDENGVVDLVVPLVSTGLPDYDHRLIEGIRRSRYSPFQINGQATPVCTTTGFVFEHKTRIKVIRH